MRRTKLFIHLKSSLWFVPVLCVLAGAALSFATIAIDRYFDYEALPHSFVGGPDAAAYILSTVAASMVGLRRSFSRSRWWSFSSPWVSFLLASCSAFCGTSTVGISTKQDRSD